MILQLEHNISAEQQGAIEAKLNSFGYKPNQVSTQARTYLVAIGKNPVDLRQIGSLPGVADIHRVTDNYKLVSRQWKVDRTVIDLGDGIKIGAGDFTVMAGPCSIESEEQVEKVVAELVKQGIRIMRGGVYKPRSSPYSFRGLGMDGLKMFYRICRESGIRIITEVMEVGQIEPMVDYVDIFQIGARNSQNFNLLEAVGKTQKAVMIKRGISGTIDELLYSAEYVFSCGNERLLLCERGIRSFENSYRNTLDLNAVPVLKDKTHLPVIVDPSHGIGVRKYVAPMALAGLACGADGLIIETHPIPEKAYSDGQQTLDFREMAQLMSQLKTMEEAMSA